MSEPAFIRADSQLSPAIPSKDIPEPRNPARIPRGRSKADLSYWRTRVFKPVWRRSDGVKVQSANFAVEFSFRNNRVKWTLDTPNREAAAARAKEIFLFVQANGWEAALQKYRPREAPKPKASELTVGEFLQAVEATRRFSRRTFSDYAKALRRIVSQIAGIQSTNRKFGGSGRQKRLQAIDTVRLAEIYPRNARALET